MKEVYILMMLLSFQNEQENRDKLLQEPVNLEKKSEEVPAWAKNSKPLYVPNGMKPRYTGYVPRMYLLSNNSRQI